MPGLVVLITGASGGIGAATAIRLAKNSRPNSPLHIEAMGIHFGSNIDAAISVLHKVQNANRDIRAEIFHSDMAISIDINRLYNDVIRAFGHIDVLFANAGTTSGKSGPNGGLNEVSLADFEATWRINTLAPYQLTQLVVPHMIEQNFGRIIYNSSVAALTGGVVGPHYASSKSALHGMMHYLAGKYAKEGITFNCVAPALIEDTAMLPKGGDELKARIPVGRLGKPEEIASVVQAMIENGYNLKQSLGDRWWLASAVNNYGMLRARVEDTPEPLSEVKTSFNSTLIAHI